MVAYALAQDGEWYMDGLPCREGSPWADAFSSMTNGSEQFLQALVDLKGKGWKTEGILHAIAMAEDLAAEHGIEGRTLADVIDHLAALARPQNDGMTK